MSKKNKLKKQSKIEDIKVFKQFKKQQIFKQITFVFAALVIGFWINTFILDWKISNNLKANILEKTNKKIEKQADIFIKKNNDLMKLKTWKQIDKVKNISFSFTYNPEKVKILDIFPNINTTRIENQKWITTFIINFEKAKTFKKWEDIINFYTSKSSKNSENINLINANFTDNKWTKFDLTTSWIIF